MSEGKDSGPSFLNVARWILVPIFVAVIAWYYTTETNKTQIEASTAAANTEYRMDLIDMISKHLADEDPTIALALLAVLESIDPDNADRIRLAILKEPRPEVASAEKPEVSAAVRIAVKDDVELHRPELMDPRAPARLRGPGAALSLEE
jgi:hypothetical protein